MSLLIFLWALVNLVEMNNTITYAVCSEHYGVEPYAYSHIQEVIRNSSSFHRNVPDFTEKDKARNASSVSGLLPQDAAKLVIIYIIARKLPRFSWLRPSLLSL